VYATDGTAQWTSATGGNAGARLRVQADGNVVIYSASNKALWASRSKGTGARLVLQGDGNLVAYDGANRALWAGKRSTGAIDSLVGGETLAVGERITSANGRYEAVVQGDGNVVVKDLNTDYAGYQAIWASRTRGSGAALRMQADGNLVLVAAGRAVWNTHTGGNPGARLVLQPNGNLVVYSATNRALWNAGIPPHYVAPTSVQNRNISCRSIAGGYEVEYETVLTGGVYQRRAWKTNDLLSSHLHGETLVLPHTSPFSGSYEELEFGGFDLRGGWFAPTYEAAREGMPGAPYDIVVPEGTIAVSECTG
jgi:hypothetical protein